MSCLSDLKVKQSYRSSRDNFADDFFVPTLRLANQYDRAVGFFSSGSLYSLSRGLYEFAKNGGKIRLIASPYLTEEDFLAIEKGYKSRDEVIEKAAIRSLSDADFFPADNRLNFLTHLINKGLLDIRLAFMDTGRGLYHEKIGLISDVEGNEIAFSGSLNETNQAFTENFESIEVYCNWRSSDECSRVKDKREEFESLWAGEERGVCVKRFEAVEKAIVEKYFRKTTSFVNFDERKPLPLGFPETRISLRNYQQEAIKKFLEQNGCGIFDMATGTGKTFTALGAIVELNRQLVNQLGVVIVAPFQHLVEQWADEVKQFNINPIVAYSDSADSKWHRHVKNAVSDLQKKIGDPPFFCILTTNATFCSKKFQECFWQHWMPPNLMLVVDEAHNFGAENKKKYLDARFKYRLALSATLDRHHDEEGTTALYDYFGQVCISYDLEKAIKERMLTPYEYYPIFVSMSEDERQAYLELTKVIGKGIRKNKDGTQSFAESAKRAMIERANLVATISGKIPKLIEVLKRYCETHEDKGHILIYCGTSARLPHCEEILQSNRVCEKESRQIEKIVAEVSKLPIRKPSMYTSETPVDVRKSVTKLFDAGDSIKALVAIKCLDEGVSISSVRTAFILASTTNPKEYIQRRGRVLRLFKGKEKAEIYDFITVPYPLNQLKLCKTKELESFKTLMKNEMERYNEFARIAQNGSGIIDARYISICSKFGIGF